MHQLSIALVHAAKVPSALCNQELVVVLEHAVQDTRRVLMTEVVHLPDHIDENRTCTAELPFLELPPTMCATVSIAADVGYPQDVCSVRDSNDDDVARLQPSVDDAAVASLQLELFVFLAIPSSPSEAPGRKSIQRSVASDARREKLLLLAQTRWSVPLAHILYVVKIKGILLGTAVGHFGVHVSVAPKDRQGFAGRLVAFFEHVNPSRLDNVPVIVADPQVDEVAVFSKLHEKYIRHVPAFSQHGSLVDRVQAMFAVYELGTPRAASALLQQWKGRELQLLATLCSEHGPEAWEIPLETRIAALCAAHNVPKDEWDAMYEEQRRIAMEAAGGNAGQIDAWNADAFGAMQRLIGREPNPHQYLFPASRIVSNSDLKTLYHDVLDRHRLLRGTGQAASGTTNVEGLRDYVAQQFANDTSFQAYRHLGSEEQTKVALRKLQSTSVPWPLTSSQGSSPTTHQGRASSFVYDPEAQRLVTGHAPGESAHDAKRRAPTLAELEKRDAASARCASILVQTHHAYVAAAAGSALQAEPQLPSTVPPDRGVHAQVDRGVPSVQHRSLLDVDQGSLDAGGAERPQEMRHASVSGDVWRAHTSAHKVLRDVGSASNPHRSTAAHAQQLPPGFVFNQEQEEDARSTFQEDVQAPNAWYEGTVGSRRAGMKLPGSADGPHHVSDGTQTNPWGDLPAVQRDMFLLSDTQGSMYAWATFVESAEQAKRVPFDRLLYLSEAQFEDLCLELGTPLALRDRIVGERQRLLLASLRTEFYSDGSDTTVRMYNDVMLATRQSVQRLQFRSVAQAAIVAHSAHASIFEGHVARHQARLERVEAASNFHNSQSGGDRARGGKHGFDASSVCRRVVLVKPSCASAQLKTGHRSHDGTGGGVWDWIVFGMPTCPVRFFHNFWSGVRDAYRQYVASCAAASALGAPSALPLHECPFDILLCDVLVGTNVLQTASMECPADLPEEFDSAVVGLGSDVEESTLVYDTQHVLVTAVLLGCRVDPDMVGCHQHAHVPAVFRRGCASQLVSTALRSQMGASELLELQATPPMCVQCLAERALVMPRHPQPRAVQEQRQRDLAPTVLLQRGSSSVASAASEATVSSSLAAEHRAPGLSGADSVRKHLHSTTNELPEASLTPPSGRPREMMDRAWALWRRGSTNACLGALERLAMDCPESSEAAEAQGLLCELVDHHYVNAATHYREACRRNPDATSALYRLANVLETRLGNQREAYDCFQRAAALGDAIAQRRAMGLELLLDGTPATDEPGVHRAGPQSEEGAGFGGGWNIPALRPPVSGGALYVPNPTAYANKQRRAF